MVLSQYWKRLEENFRKRLFPRFPKNDEISKKKSSSLFQFSERTIASTQTNDTSAESPGSQLSFATLKVGVAVPWSCHALSPRKAYFVEFYGRGMGFWLLAFYEMCRTHFFKLQSLSRGQIKAEIKGFLLMYRLFQYKHWFLPNCELKDFPELTFTPCMYALF